MSKISDRLMLIIQKEGISIRKFESLIGCSYGVIQKSIKNKTDISSALVSKITEIFPQYGADWILTGRGEPGVKDVIADPEIKYCTIQQTQNIPLVDLSVIAGFGSGTFSISQSDIRAFYAIPDFGKVDFMIHVYGNSMYPKYNSGDIIACRRILESKFIQWNKCHVVATKEQGILVKRLKKNEDAGYITAVSDNPDYPAFDIPVSEIDGLALVVGVIRLE